MSMSYSELTRGVDQMEQTKKQPKTAEEQYREHIKHESPKVTYNTHPDGCWYCGSLDHHSQDCTHKDE
jgi:hypothetical protein